MGAKNKPLNIDKNSLEKLYIEEKLSTVEISKIYNCSHKTVSKYLDKYGIDRRTMSEAITISSAKRTDEVLKNRAIKFAKTWYSRPQEERDRINKTRRTKPENIELSKQKRLETISKTSGGTKSKSEDLFYRKLLLYFNSDDIVRGYSDSRYPFSCDFYIKSDDIFIEYQGHYTHGYAPFDKSDKNHLLYLEKMSKKANMDTWTIRDPNKLNVAIKNKITLILVYPKHDVYIVKDGKITTLQIDKIVINK